jgi:oxygen-independent coproporphyrinogen-3 oxidase
VLREKRLERPSREDGACAERFDVEERLRRMSLGVYIQVPFCQTKCTYCNFHTGPASRSLYAPYAHGVVREISEHAGLYRAAGLTVRTAGHVVDTVYLGGGTPSLLDPSDLAAILDSVRANFSCDWKEVTLEADPETIEAENAGAWRSSGINRVSLGSQSFNDRELIAAGRMHRRDDIPRAVERLRAAGTADVSLDLIAGLPHQTIETWQASLDAALALHPEHISIYLLEIDEGSRLGRESLAGGARYGAADILDDDSMAACYQIACERLAEARYEHYEISNWAIPGHESRHNLKYWRRDSYLGFGAGAHSFNGTRRWANAHDPAAYVAAIEQGRLPIEQVEEVTQAAALEEELFLGLRELAGIDLARIEREYGVDLKGRVQELVEQGLLLREGVRIRLAPDRLAVSNEVFVALLAETSASKGPHVKGVIA